MSLTNDCGHSVASEDSVLRCSECEAEQRKREDDATWNAAIEAAAQIVGEELAQKNGWIQQRIRALKREAK